MNISKIVSIYFSPNGTTKQIVNRIAQGIGNCDVQEIDLTYAKNRSIKHNFNNDELVVIGLPVYADRLPKLSAELFKVLKGNSNPAVAIVSYGNRDYGDALLELKNNLTASGMRVIAGAAIVAEHCLNKNVATNRPDKKDDLKILDYANCISNKIKNTQQVDALSEIDVKGNYPYSPLKPNQIPTGDETCIACGLCKETCPVEAIDESDYKLTNSNACIGCGKCINVCPTNARAVRNEEYNKLIKSLEVRAKDRKEMEVFI